jgi:hypothetical protein
VTCKWQDGDGKPIEISTDQPGTAEQRTFLDERIDNVQAIHQPSDAQVDWLEAARDAVHAAATDPAALHKQLARFPLEGIASASSDEAKLTDHIGADGSTVNGEWQSAHYQTAQGAETHTQNADIRLTGPDGTTYDYRLRHVEVNDPDMENLFVKSDITLNGATPTDRQLAQFNEALAAAAGGDDSDDF